MKTSLTHPLPIPAVAAGRGRLGMCMCPGKQQPHAATGPWHRDLALDMDVLSAFDAAIVITLMEADELETAVAATALAGSANLALAADIERHLDGLPVSARPDTLGYRARKFVSRNRGAVVAAAAITLRKGICQARAACSAAAA